MGRQKKPLAPAPAPANRPFAALAGLREQLPSGPAPVPAALEPAREPAPAEVPARAVVRYQRKGRGGKEVTIVEKLALAPAALEQLSRALKSSLGVGGGVEGEVIVLQGDCRERAAAFLRGRGVGKITLG